MGWNRVLRESPADEARPMVPDPETQRAERVARSLGHVALTAIAAASGLMQIANAILIIGIVAQAIGRRSWAEVPSATFLLSLAISTVLSVIIYQWSTKLLKVLNERY